MAKTIIIRTCVRTLPSPVSVPPSPSHHNNSPGPEWEEGGGHFSLFIIYNSLIVEIERGRTSVNDLRINKHDMIKNAIIGCRVVCVFD